MATNRGKPTSIEFSDELRTKIDDFCKIGLGASLASLVRKAVEEYIDRRLDTETETKRQYEQVRRERLAAERGNIRVLEGGLNGE